MGLPCKDLAKSHAKYVIYAKFDEPVTVQMVTHKVRGFIVDLLIIITSYPTATVMNFAVNSEHSIVNRSLRPSRIFFIFLS